LTDGITIETKLTYGKHVQVHFT